MSLGEFSIATHHWDASKGSVHIKYSSGADNNEVRADGQDDARLTFRGRKTCKISVKLQWKRDYGPGGVGRGFAADP